jgi:hypothetical protein
MIAKIMLLTLLVGCNNHSIPEKIIVPKPLINEVMPKFRKIDVEFVDEKICLTKENAENLIYNIAMSRIYFNQSQMNLQLTQNYYSKIVVDLGAIEN